MRRADLEAIRQSAVREPHMTRVALDNLANADDVRRQLRRTFEKSMRSHESVDQLIGRIQQVCDMSYNRARTIAQTERTRAANGQRYADAVDEYLKEYDKAVKWHKKRPDKPLMQWINPRYAKEPRPHHVDISGTVRPIGERWLGLLYYPGDPNGPPGETINCHCYIRRWR